jgi:dihydrofolate synthase/folylpolyglutamate synthase
MLASILQSAGYRTGLYTSPHLKSFTERVKVDGQEIEQEYVVKFVNRIHDLIVELKPSFFEITVALAFDYFASKKVDIAVIEVGLGGRLDSTNVITPEISVITNIGWDHTDMLGDTLPKIAAEKAGIIKHNSPVVVSERQPEVEHVFLNKAKESGTEIIFAADRFALTPAYEDGMTKMNVFERGKLMLEDLCLPLQGDYQQKNVIGVLSTIALLREKGWKISNASVRQGLVDVVVNTGLKGRWQVLGQSPLVICDTGHNLDGIREVANQIQRQSYKQLYMVVGMVKGKDALPILRLLPRDAYYFFCQAKIPRAMDASDLAQLAISNGLKGEVIADVNDAVEAAKALAHVDDMIFIGGSTYVVAEIKGV